MHHLACFVLLLIAGSHARDFTFQNNLGYTIWIGSLANPGYPQIADGGWQLDNGQSVTQGVPDDWRGRFWGRTGCNFDGDGNGACETGDCGNGLRCNGNGGQPPATLAEFTLQGSGGLDYYDISLVDGFNVPVSITPTDQTGADRSCTTAGCTADINGGCPEDLKYRNGNGDVVGCSSTCTVQNTDETCCRGNFGSAQTCQPGESASYFKGQCPDAYSFAYDDSTSTYTCQNTNYRIDFG